MANADPAEEDLLVAKPEDVLALVAARTKLERSIAARDQLTEQCALLRDKLTQQADEQAEIFAYLNSELQQKSRALVDLEAQVAALGERVREGQEKFDKELIAEKSEAREATVKLATEVGKYEQELGDLNIFISRKHELEGELEDTTTELLRERKRHEQTIAELERKTVQEKDRLRKDMEAKIRDAKESFMKLTDSQLESTTKKTMHANEQMASELAFQNRETERLMLRNKKLSEENFLVRKDLNSYEQAEQELSRRNHAYLKTINSLVSKLKSLEDAKQLVSRSSKEKEEHLNSVYRQRVMALQTSVEETYQQLEQIHTNIQAKDTEVSRLESLGDDLSIFLLKSAAEVRSHFSAAGRSVTDDSLSQPASRRDGGGTLHDHVRLQRLADLPPDLREEALRMVVARVAELELESRTADTPRSAAGDGAASPTREAGLLPHIAALSSPAAGGAAAARAAEGKIARSEQRERSVQARDTRSLR